MKRDEDPTPTDVELDALPPDEGPERSICIVRPATFRARPMRGIGLVLLGVAGIAIVVTGFVKAPEGQAVRGWLALLGVATMLLAAGSWLFWWISATLWRRLEISNKRTTRHEGIIRRHSTEVLHDHVRSVDIRQSFLQRIFDVGDIGIDSAGQDDIEIEIRDIPSPDRVKEIIDRYREM